MTNLENLVNWFEDKDKVMIALSGGVDSALVAYAAYQKLGNSAIAVTADYKTLSREELDTAKQVCSEIGITHLFLDYSELENDDFTKNDSDRCSSLVYLIKKEAGCKGFDEITSTIKH